MISRSELEETIKNQEKNVRCYTDLEKLSTLYTVYDHCFAERQDPTNTVTEQIIIRADGETDFLRLIDGKKAEQVWAVIDETMSTLQVLQPRLYAGVMRRLSDF